MTQDNNKEVRNLEPNNIWEHFTDLNAIPRPSKKEERVIEFMKNFGEDLGLETIVDDIGNVIIKKPASKGKEDRPTVILQSHLDMVHQKNSDTDFDFAKEGIRMFIDGDWVKAKGTTLGADNGIGVAAIMALLSTDDIPHPPLEALFTIDEETGMTGAKKLDPNVLEGKILLNLDSEEDDVITIGCAGGLDTTTTYKYHTRKPDRNSQAYQIKVRGLKGGHSGMDIIKGRGNANKLMNRLLYQAAGVIEIHLASIDGGGLRNAIPRESTAIVVVPVGHQDQFKGLVDTISEDIKREYTSIEPDLDISLEKTDLPEAVVVPEDQHKILSAIHAVHDGVFRMDPDIDGLVETSSNLARVVVEKGVFSTQSLQRSSVESGKQNVADTVRAAFETIGAEVENSGDYPGWAPDASSRILKEMEGLYESLFDEKVTVESCHAGLECGIIGKRYPGLDMISFGPTIQHAHSPDEQVQISSVKKFWKYLTAALDEI